MVSQNIHFINSVQGCITGSIAGAITAFHPHTEPDKHC